MPQSSFSAETMPQSGEELRQALRHALDHTTPLDDSVQLIRDLAQYEIRYGMDSANFSARFEAGELGDAVDLIRWADKFEIYEEAKAELNQMVELVEAYALPVLA